MFEKSNNIINMDCDYYFNLLSENNLSLNNNIISGTYQIDSNKNYIPKILTQLESIDNIKINKSQTNNSFTEKVGKALLSQPLSIVLVILLLILIFLSTIGITTNWINSRQKEIFIKRLVGCNPKFLKYTILKEYFLLLTISFLIGFIVAYIIGNLRIKIFFEFKFSILTSVTSYIFTMILGSISGIIMMKNY